MFVLKLGFKWSLTLKAVMSYFIRKRSYKEIPEMFPRRSKTKSYLLSVLRWKEDLLSGKTKREENGRKLNIDQN